MSNNSDNKPNVKTEDCAGFVRKLKRQVGERGTLTGHIALKDLVSRM